MAWRMRHWSMPASPAGFCRTLVGDIEVTFVPDGYICSSPTRSYPGTDDAFWAGHPDHLDDDGFLVMSLGALLVRTAGKLLLIDLAWGPSSTLIGVATPGEQQGRVVGGALLDNLRLLGVQPGDVDAVLFSHLHRDHTGWIVDPTSSDGEGTSGTPTFGNAHHYLSSAEWAYWSAAAESGVGPAPSSEQLAVLSSRLSFLEDGEHVLPGIDVMATFGHTPGHLSFVISSGNERAIVLGDAVHCPVEILEPELTFSVDVDPKLAQRTRLFIEQALLEPDTVAAAPHFADLVFGRLMRGEGKSSWHFPASQALTIVD
jgi:glyoxylase-like metal-dependent hydrolase (beta-lactamase superfamily II)